MQDFGCCCCTCTSKRSFSEAAPSHPPPPPPFPPSFPVPACQKDSQDPDMCTKPMSQESEGCGALAYRRLQLWFSWGLADLKTCFNSIKRRCGHNVAHLHVEHEPWRTNLQILGLVSRGLSSSTFTSLFSRGSLIDSFAMQTRGVDTRNTHADAR